MYGILQPVTKIIYPDIASKHKTRPHRVARAIRHAIERAFLEGDSECIDKIFKGTVRVSSGKATNVEFIATVANYILLSEEYNERGNKKDL